MALATGSRLGPYEIVAPLGAGGMGEVYVARDTTLGRRIALKVLPTGCERDRIARFIREAQASSALNHPAIVSVHDAGSADGIHFLAMELIDGEPLSSWMRSHRNARRATELMAQVADGLAGAHDAGIVHRDLKPANIMIGRNGHQRCAALFVELVHTRRPLFFDGVRIIHILSRDGRSAAFTRPSNESASRTDMGLRVRFGLSNRLPVNAA